MSIAKCCSRAPNDAKQIKSAHSKADKHSEWFHDDDSTSIRAREKSKHRYSSFEIKYFELHKKIATNCVSVAAEGDISVAKKKLILPTFFAPLCFYSLDQWRHGQSIFKLDLMPMTASCKVLIQLPTILDSRNGHVDIFPITATANMIMRFYGGWVAHVCRSTWVQTTVGRHPRRINLNWPMLFKVQDWYSLLIVTNCQWFTRFLFQFHLIRTKYIGFTPENMIRFRIYYEACWIDAKNHYADIGICWQVVCIQRITFSFQFHAPMLLTPPSLNAKQPDESIRMNYWSVYISHVPDFIEYGEQESNIPAFYSILQWLQIIHWTQSMHMSSI